MVTVGWATKSLRYGDLHGGSVVTSSKQRIVFNADETKGKCVIIPLCPVAVRHVLNMLDSRPEVHYRFAARYASNQIVKKVESSSLTSRKTGLYAMYYCPLADSGVIHLLISVAYLLGRCAATASSDRGAEAFATRSRAT